MTAACRSATCDCAEDCSVADSCSPSREPCLYMKRVYVKKIRLCDDLEAIADSLPLHINRFSCLSVASQLLPALRQSHRYEEQVLFPAFERGAGANLRSRQSVQRLKAEHICDEGAAEEITEALMWVGRGGDIANPEALGFMLRAFFDAVRRHIAFEREHVFQSLGKRLDAGDARQFGETRNFDVAIAHDQDSLRAQLRHLTAHCLDREAKEIRNVGTRKRQVK
jgi:hypothetical protein